MQICTCPWERAISDVFIAEVTISVFISFAVCITDSIFTLKCNHFSFHLINSLHHRFDLTLQFLCKFHPIWCFNQFSFHSFIFNISITDIILHHRLHLLTSFFNFNPTWIFHHSLFGRIYNFSFHVLGFLHRRFYSSILLLFTYTHPMCVFRQEKYQIPR